MNIIYNQTDIRIRHTSVVYSKESESMPFNVLYIYEVLEHDMQDFEDEDVQRSFKEEGISIKVQTFTTTGKELRNIIEEALGNRRSSSLLRYPEGEDLYAIYSSDYKSEPLSEITPFRKGPCYAVSYIDQGVTRALLKNEGCDVTNLTRILHEELGINLATHVEYIGSVNLIWHHPWLRKFDLRASDNPNGVLVMAESRDNEKHRVTIQVEDMGVGNTTVQSKFFPCVELSRCMLLRLSQPVGKLNIKVYDEDGDLIYGLNEVSFIRQINVNIGVVDNLAKTTGKALYKEKMQIGNVRENAQKILAEAKQKRDVVAKITELLKALPVEGRLEVLTECMSSIKGKEALDDKD